ncbi:hypothetical protein E2C01_067562 [Portunus trituberculatus]|uniref:Uncharacterized protein n=1 Tax=Portunus trituberculatus TaxID=210409 RepID=A0A5B7HLC6_PORTR|nr:hypothetical protein [Portunus trituberculatus]
MCVSKFGARRAQPGKEGKKQTNRHLVEQREPCLHLPLKQSSAKEEEERGEAQTQHMHARTTSSSRERG